MSSQVLEQNVEDCAREPIHIPGAIQPHGALLVLTEPDLKIVQVSANISRLFEVEPENLLERRFPDLLEAEPRAKLAAALASDDPGSISPLPLQLGSQRLDAVFHRTDGLLVVELEPAPAAGENFAQHHRRL